MSAGVSRLVSLAWTIAYAWLAIVLWAPLFTGRTLAQKIMHEASTLNLMGLAMSAMAGLLLVGLAVAVAVPLRWAARLFTRGDD